jgi:hypothetical protein
VFDPALPGRSIPEKASPLAVDLDQRGVDAQDDRVAPVVTDERAQVFSRTVANAVLRSARVFGVTSWKLRQAVESEGTKPNRVSSDSMSAQLSPPPAIVAIW